MRRRRYEAIGRLSAMPAGRAAGPEKKGRPDLNDPNALNGPNDPNDPNGLSHRDLELASFAIMSSADVAGRTALSIAAIRPVLSM